jgi:hypothetical protein
MSTESRKSLREPVTFEIMMACQSGELHRAVTRDVSEGGMFVLISSEQRPILGELVTISLMGDSPYKINLPSPEAVVVHTAPQGLGLAYIFLELDDEQ